MAETYRIGEDVLQAFTLGVAGETITRVVSYIGVDTSGNPIEVEWNPEFTDNGDGTYTAVYRPDAAGAHAWVGISDPTGWDVEINFDVIGSSSPSATTLWELRAAVARLCDDWVEFIASEDSADTSVMIDTLAGVENDEHFRGSEVWFKIDEGTNANRGLKVRCTSSSRDDGSISLGPGLASPPVTDDVAYIFNIGGEGTRIRTIDASINDAIKSLGQASGIACEEVLEDDWDQDVYWVSIPPQFSHIKSVFYGTDSDATNYMEVPSHGWTIDPVGKKIAISPEFAAYAHGNPVRLTGKTAHPKLTADDDTTDVDFGWLTKEVAAQILLKKHDQIMVNKGGMLKNEADALLGRAGILTLEEGLVRVR